MEEVLSEDFEPTEVHVGKTVYIRPKRKKIGTDTYTWVCPEKEASIVKFKFPPIERKFLNLGPTSNEDVKILSYNVMGEKSKSGRNQDLFPAWHQRKQLLVKQILEYKPDIICLQEVLPEYYTYCEKRLGKFKYIGKYGSRDKGEKWEATFYKSNRFECTDKETFKYADKAKDLPDEAAKKYYDHPQIALFLKLKFTDVDDAKEFVVVNTHLVGKTKSNTCIQNDEYQKDARLFQAKMLCGKLRSLYLDRQQSTKIIVCGDFNSGISSECYKFLAAGGGIDLENAYDTLRRSEIIEEKDKRIYMGGKGGATTIILKINQWSDHIWHNKGGLECNEVLKLSSVSSSKLLLSDHAPIIARFSFEGFSSKKD